MNRHWPTPRAEQTKARAEALIPEFNATNPKMGEAIEERFASAVKKAKSEFQGKLEKALENHGVKFETIVGLDGDPKDFSLEVQTVAAHIVSGELDKELEKLGTSLKKMAANDGNKGAVTAIELKDALTLAQASKSVAQNHSK